ncbi:hypothetical protein AC1031_001523 [Aphanomyces cochlioides]|nr:hypothetical protein AC1031_001523 [Aphanomyces cochlioides]
MPFPRPVVLLQCQGRELKEAIEQHLRTYPLLSGSYPHVSDLRVKYDRTKEPPHVSSLQDDQGHDIDLDEYVTLQRSFLKVAMAAWRGRRLRFSQQMMRLSKLSFVFLRNSDWSRT